MWQNTIEREPYDETFIGLIIRKDLLDKAGLDIPVTLDDWYEALVAFKDMGIKHPISFMGTYATLAQSFASAFDITLPVVGMPGMGSDFALREDGTIQYGPAEDGYGEYLTFMHRLYELSLIHILIISQSLLGPASCWPVCAQRCATARTERI